MSENENDLVIDVYGLYKSFGKIKAVQDFSIQLARGRIFGFLGPNGSGKTTTIRMLCGLFKVDQGYGTCLGFDLLTQASEIRRHVGYMTQHFSLYEDLTVQENLELVVRLYDMAPVKDIVASQLHKMGLMDKRHVRAKTLSGGWKQRLALAACTIHAPELLLLDEPTAGVDPQARREFWDQIHHFAAQGTTVLVSTHYMDEVERCHEIAYISKGHLLTRGTLEDILARSGMVTWIVDGPDLLTLSTILKTQPGVEQIGFMGNSLRLSSTTPDVFLQTIADFKKNNHYRWQETQANAEDLFILMAKEA
ncbi:MAG: ABC transporter ATP-binding protein [Alphaproteobacteria bacterium]